MWIRSQSKKQLYKSFGFEIVNGDVYCLFGTTVSKIGSYSTEEKALKVLDMIQKYIGGKTKYYIAQDIGNPNGYHVFDDMNIPMCYCNNGIFQMPEDEKV